GYCTGHRSVHRKGCDGAPPGFVIITFPDPPGWRPPHTFLTSLSVVGFVVPGSTAITLIFFGVTPPTVAVAPSLIFVPVISRKNWPVSCLSSLQLVTTAMSGVGLGFGFAAVLHVNSMHGRHPSSVPSGHPVGCPVTAAVNPRLVPPVPVTHIMNVC